MKRSANLILLLVLIAVVVDVVLTPFWSNLFNLENPKMQRKFSADVTPRDVPF